MPRAAPPNTPSRPFIPGGDANESLNEADFLIAVLTAHEVVEPLTLAVIRKQYQSLTQGEAKLLANCAPANGEGRPTGAPQPGQAAMSPRTVFARHVSDGRVRQRPSDGPVGASLEAPPQEGMRPSRIALVDLDADDGGYAEWHEHHWAPKVTERWSEKHGPVGGAEAGAGVLPPADVAKLAASLGCDGGCGRRFEPHDSLYTDNVSVDYCAQCYEQLAPAAQAPLTLRSVRERATAIAAGGGGLAACWNRWCVSPAAGAAQERAMV